MRAKTHIIYVPGFGDKYDGFRLWALRHWRFRGITTEVVPMHWTKGTFAQKLARLDRAIDRADGKRIVLIGESAGGSMVVHEYARRADDLYKVVTICGKNTRPETVGQRYFDSSPAFESSMRQLNSSIDDLTFAQRKAFVSIHPLYDPVVPIRDTLLPGCRQVRLPAIGHLITIMLALTVFSPIVIRASR